MKALSIRQPWAWLIVHGGKDIENRSWSTNFRGRFLIHAAAGMTKAEYQNAYEFCRAAGVIKPPYGFPFNPDMLQRGGIVGAATITDCVAQSDSPWFCGEYGFVLQDAAPCTFVPYRGQLGWFDIPRDVLDTIYPRNPDA